MKENIEAIVDGGVVDLRKGCWGLKSLVGDIDLGVCYLFSNRTRNLCKVIRFDQFGVEVVTRRLNKGCFQWPESPTGTTTINSVEMNRIFSGKKYKKVCF